MSHHARTLRKFSEIVDVIANGKLALLCPGQGSQYVGMGRELCAEFPKLKQIYKDLDVVTGVPLSELMWSGPADELRLTRNAQPAIVAHTIASYRYFIALLEKYNLEHVKSNIQYILGHSLGEFSALSINGTWSYKDAIRIARKRGELMSRDIHPVSTGMMALFLKDPSMSHLVAPVMLEEEGNLKDPRHMVDISSINSSTQMILSGSLELIRRITDRLKDEKIIKRSMTLPNVSQPFHSRYLQVNELGCMLEKFGNDNSRVISNVTAQPMDSQWKSTLLKQAYSTVKWSESIDYCRQHGVNVFIELGPGSVLTKLLSQDMLPLVHCWALEDLENNVS